MNEGSSAPTDTAAGPERLFAGHPFALVVVDRVRSVIDAIGPASMGTTKSQIAFRRQRGFAYLWPPVFGGRGVEIVLSIALPRRDDSRRWKQVAHPARDVWMHHLEVRSLDEVDDEVASWLREAYENAA